MSADCEVSSRLDQHRAVWAAKPVLADLYQREFFDRIISRCVPGRVVEIGGGPGFFKEYRPGTISLDIMSTNWLDLVADAQRLPLRHHSVDNLVCTDVLHHLADPMALLAEAARVLRPGGRLVMVEPWHTPLSALIYRHFHEEDFDPSWQPGSTREPGKDPFEANQAIPSVLFTRCWDDANRLVPELRLVEIQPFSLFAYLLSFGFQRPCLLPRRLYRTIARVEDVSRPLWVRGGALRAVVVVERR